MHTIMKNLLRTVTGAALVSFWTVSQAQAAAFSTRTEDPAGLGQSYGGVTAHAVALSSQYYNPAHLAAFRAQEILLSTPLSMPRVKASNAAATTAVGTPVAGGQDNQNAAKSAVTPTFAAALPITDRITAGLNATVPWGLSTSYESDWVGRYRALTSEIKSLNVTPAIAGRLTKNLSVGGGVQIQHFGARLTNAVDCGTIDVANGFALGLTPGTPASDCAADLDGDDWGYGFTLGATYRLTPQTTIGAAYRSSIDHTLKGDVRYDVPSPILALVLPDASASAALTTPALASVGISHMLNDRLRVGLDVQRIGWSVYEDLRADFESTQADAVTRGDWHDIWFVGVGTEYAASKDWTLRGGVAYEQAPVPDATRDPRVPIGETYWLGLGASYVPLPALRVDLTAFRAWFADTHTDLPVDGVNTSLTADYEASNTVAAVQVSLQF